MGSPGIVWLSTCPKSIVSYLLSKLLLKTLEPIGSRLLQTLDLPLSFVQHNNFHHSMVSHPWEQDANFSQNHLLNHMA